MRYAHPEYIGILIVVMGLVILGIFWGLKLRRKRLESFAHVQAIPLLAAQVSDRMRFIALGLRVLAMLFLFIALMRPQWGFQWQEVKRKGLDIIIALDTSKSMMAEDVKPNRLERSKLAVKDLLKKMHGDRIGLIAFSGAAFLQCPLTVDYNGFLLSLDSLAVDTIPRGGTSISAAIKEALRSYKGGMKKYQVLVLITDGEDHEGNAAQLAEEAKKEGIKIYCIGIGTKDGELIPVTDETGKRTFLKDRSGAVVKSRLDEALLQKIALVTGGSYVRATGSEFGLDLLYDEKLSKLEKRDLESKMSKHYEERFQIFLGIGMLLLVIESVISERRRRKI